MEASPVNLGAYWRLLQTNRNFRLLWIGQLVSQCGDWLYMLSIFDLLLELTGSAKAVSLAFVTMVLPQTFVSPAAGVLNDRLSRRRMMLVADWARAVIVLAMLLGQSNDRLWLLYTLLVLETVFWALYEPARTAVIPNITSGGEETLVANALSSVTWSVTLALGSAIGGLMAASMGRNLVFGLNAASFVVSAYCAWAMRFREPHLEHVEPLRLRDLTDFRPIAEGFRYVSHDRKLFATLFVKAGLGVMGTNWVLLTLFGERVYPLKVEGFDARSGGLLSMSLLMGVRGIGAFAGPLLAGRLTGNDHRRFRIAILAAFALGSFGYLCLGQADHLWLACLCVFIAHSGGSVAWVYSTTLLQAHTVDRVRGRVFSAEFAMSMLTISIVSYTAGVLADEGWSPHALASVTGLTILIPMSLWGFALHRWFREPSGER